MSEPELNKNDHRVIGRELELFVVSDLVGKGLPMLLPKGNTLKNELDNFITREKEALGYKFVNIPHIAKKELYIKSGHMGRYDAMMPTMTDENGEEFVMKAMNCPHHFEIYTSSPKSYRDLPLRIAENTTVYRNEKSGELSGLLRVKNLTQDDTHHFIRPDQIESEIEMIFGLIEKTYKVFGFNDYKVEISVRDPKDKEKYFGADEVWQKAEEILIKSVKKWGVKHSIVEGEAAFYGPKIDFRAKDSLGREWQLTTVQLDFNQPENFDMNYVGEDGKLHKVVVIHVAIFGSFERFMGVIIEHYEGAFPLWLSPVQVKVLPVSDKFNDYAKKVHGQLRKNFIRSELDDRQETVSYKVRDAELRKIPFTLTVGQREEESETVAVRDKSGKVSVQKLDTFTAGLAEKIGKRENA